MEYKNNALKTLKGWEASNLDLTDYLQYPCEIDEDLANYIGECVAPQYLGNGLVQGGDCEFHENNPETFEKIGFYLTTYHKDRKFFYLGVLPEFKK